MAAMRTAQLVALANEDAPRGPLAWASHTLPRQFNAAKQPLTAQLLLDLHANVRAMTNAANRAYPFRLRPWATAQPSVPALTSEQLAQARFKALVAAGKSAHEAAQEAGPSSYPSARTLATQLWAHTLAQVMPEHAGALFKAAEHSATLRLLGGAHFPSDISGAKILADAVWLELMAQPRFQSQLAAAQAEAARIKALPTQRLGPANVEIFNRARLPIQSYVSTVLAQPQPIDDIAKAAMLQAQSQRSELVLATAQKIEVMNFWAFMGSSLGPWASAENMPQLEQFLLQVRNAFEPVLVEARRQHIVARPYQVLPGLLPGWQSPPDTSYPSAKVWLFSIQAQLLADLAPQLKPQLDKAMRELEEMRITGGVHWPADVLAAGQSAKLMLAELLSSPAYAAGKAGFAAELLSVVPNATRQQ